MIIDLNFLEELQKEKKTYIYIYWYVYRKRYDEAVKIFEKK